MYLNTIDPKMQLKNYPHNFNTMNIGSLAVLPNPSDTQVATLSVQTMIPFYVFFKTIFLFFVLSGLELPWQNRLSTNSEIHAHASSTVLELMTCTINSFTFSNFF